MSRHEARVKKLEQSISKDQEIIVLDSTTRPELLDDDVMEAEQDEWISKFPGKECVFILIVRKDMSLSGGKEIDLELD